MDLLEQKFNRVTDTCIPEEEAMRVIERVIEPLWVEAKDVSVNTSDAQALRQYVFLNVIPINHIP